MAYCSEVKIIAGKNPAKEIRDVLDKAEYRTLEEVGTNQRGDTLFKLDWGKWDEVEDTTSKIMAIVDKYVFGGGGIEECADNGIEYARVGEEVTDSEYRSNGNGYGYLSIAVHCDREDTFQPKT